MKIQASGFTAMEKTGLTRDTLRSQTVVITGAGRGIGREAARAFAWLGASAVIAELSEAGAETERIIRDEGGSALFIRTDVSDAASVAALAKGTHESFGAVDILVNNAVFCPVSTVTDMQVDEWDQTIAVNLRGTFLTCKAFLPGMIQKGSGTIINMTSLDAMAGLSAYIASKQGILGFT